jgi:hypothetical protein
MVGDDRAATTNRVCRDCALLGQQTDAGEASGQLAVGLFRDEFVARIAPPEIDAADLKKFPCNAAKVLNERGRVGALRSLGRKPQEEVLKSILGASQSAAFRRRRRIASNYAQSYSIPRPGIFEIPISD